MMTLIAVSLPVEVIFLLCVIAFGWIHLPFLFMTLQIMFFLIAVRILPESLPHASCSYHHR